MIHDPALAVAAPANDRKLWKAGAILLAMEWGYGILHPLEGDGTPAINLLTALAYAIGLLGLLDYGYGWPRLPRLVWRTFGLLCAGLCVFNAAEWFGWSAARLYSRPLGLADQAMTIFQTARFIIEDMLCVVAVFRLAEWHRLSLRRPAKPQATPQAAPRAPARLVESRPAAATVEG